MLCRQKSVSECRQLFFNKLLLMIYIYIYIYDSYSNTCRSDRTIEHKCLDGRVASWGEGGSAMHKINGMNE